MKTVALASQKGGVGKTTLALNLAYAAARRGWQTLLADADPQGAIGLSLRGAEKHRRGLGEILVGAVPLAEALVPTRLPNLKILTNGGLSPARARRWSMELAEGEVFARLIAQSRSGFELLFVDTPPGLAGPTVGVLRCSDFVLCPVQAEPLSLRSAPHLLEVLEELQREGSAVRLAGFVLTMLQTRLDTSLGVARDSWKQFPGDTVLDTAVPRDPVFLEASARGVPLGLLRRRPPAVAAVFDQLVAELEPRLGLADEPGDDRPTPLL